MWLKVKNINKMTKCFALMFGYLIIFDTRCLLMHLVDLFAGNGEAHHKRHKLFEIHLSVSIRVQIPHNLVNGSRVLLSLGETKDTCLQYNRIGSRFSQIVEKELNMKKI